VGGGEVLGLEPRKDKKMVTISNGELKAEARRVLDGIEAGGASWEGVSLALAHAYLTIGAMRGGVTPSIDCGEWDGSLCANASDLEENS
jgi:hypothetical protein